MRTAKQAMSEYKKIIRISHRHGIRVFCPTWPPALHGAHSTGERNKLNAWIMNSGACDGAVDWDEVLRWEEGAPILYRPDYFADGIHPNDAGHEALAEATPMDWFTMSVLRTRGHRVD
jgi:lysophospholipase L1-like esterase